MKNIHYKILAIYLGALILLFLSGDLHAAKFKVGDCIGHPTYQKFDFTKVDGTSLVTETITTKLVILDVNDKTELYEVRLLSGPGSTTAPTTEIERNYIKINCY